jgi:MFS family permease
MGFWTVGPVGGSILATFVANQTLPVYHTWQSQYVISGTVGLIVFLVCLFGLRELSPGLHDQIMHSLQEMKCKHEKCQSPFSLHPIELHKDQIAGFATG